MPYQNPRIETLKEMMRLEEKRAGLQSEIDSLVQRLSELRDHLFEAEHRPSAPPAPSRATGRGKVIGKRGGAGPRRQRGALQEQIIAALDAAGSNGVRVQDLATAIGIKPANIHAWFHAAQKRFPQIKKVEGGHYRSEGKVEIAPRAQGSGGPRGGAGKGRRKATATGSRPGELSTRILAELQAAGEGGMSISNLSEKLGVNYRNISVWFSTTGKKNPQVQKVSPAVYRLESTKAD